MAAVAGSASRSSILLAQRPKRGPGGGGGGWSVGGDYQANEDRLQGLKSGVSLFRGVFKFGILNWRQELQEGGA